MSNSIYGQPWKFDSVNWMEVAKANGVTDFTVEDAEAMHAIAREEVNFSAPGKEWDRRTETFPVYKDSVGIETVGVGHRVRKGESFKDLSWQDGLDLYMGDYTKHRGEAQKLLGEWQGTPRWSIMSPAQRQWLVDKVFNLGSAGAAKYTDSIPALLRGDREKVMTSTVKAGGRVINRGRNANANYDQQWGSMTRDERRSSVVPEESIQAWLESVSE